MVEATNNLKKAVTPRCPGDPVDRQHVGFALAASDQDTQAFTFRLPKGGELDVLSLITCLDQTHLNQLRGNRRDWCKGFGLVAR